MGATNLSGAIIGLRSGSAPVRHTYVVSGSTSTTATKWLTIKASAAIPVLLEGQIVVSTADGGTTPTMSLGVTSTATELVSGASTATAAAGGTFLPASNATGKYRLTADTDIYYKQGGTPNGAGVTTLILDVTTVNTDTSTTQ